MAKIREDFPIHVADCLPTPRPGGKVLLGGLWDTDEMLGELLRPLLCLERPSGND